jgi:hypothetical protein
MEWLRKRAAELHIAALVDQQSRSCIEIPVILSTDDDPAFPESTR